MIGSLLPIFAISEAQNLITLSDSQGLASSSNILSKIKTFSADILLLKSTILLSSRFI
jgi:hypothetical protein